MEDTLVEPLSATEPTDLSSLCGNFVAKFLTCARKSPIYGVRMPNCGNRSGIGRRSTLGPYIGPNISKPRSSNLAVRTGNSKINSSVERARPLVP